MVAVHTRLLRGVCDGGWRLARSSASGRTRMASARMPCARSSQRSRPCSGRRPMTPRRRPVPRRWRCTDRSALEMSCPPSPDRAPRPISRRCVPKGPFGVLSLMVGNAAALGEMGHGALVHRRTQRTRVLGTSPHFWKLTARATARDRERGTHSSQRTRRDRKPGGRRLARTRSHAAGGSLLRPDARSESRYPRCPHARSARRSRLAGGACRRRRAITAGRSSASSVQMQPHASSSDDCSGARSNSWRPIDLRHREIPPTS
jgi:hypothetical protein